MFHTCLQGLFATGVLGAGDIVGEMCGRLEVRSALALSLSSSIWYHKTLDIAIDARLTLHLT